MNRRELELTKNLSLAQWNPVALLSLRETGRCYLSVREEWFDIDYQGHYFRRIKSVRSPYLASPGLIPLLTVPCAC